MDPTVLSNLIGNARPSKITIERAYPQLVDQIDVPTVRAPQPLPPSLAPQSLATNETVELSLQELDPCAIETPPPLPKRPFLAIDVSTPEHHDTADDAHRPLEPRTDRGHDDAPLVG